MRHPRAGRPLVAGSVYVAVLTVLAALSAWPIYRSTAFLVLVVVAAVVGAAIAGAAWALRWPTSLVAAAIAGAVLVLGVPLAVPARLGSPREWAAGLLDVVRGVVTAWKDLLTVPLPAGDYRNLLVPALLVFLVGVPLALLLAWRRPPVSATAVLVGAGMVSFGLLFGRTQVSAPLELGMVTIPAPVETAIGVAGLVASLVWLAWQAYDERARSLRRAAAATGVRITRSRAASDTRRMLLGGGMLIVSAIVGALVSPALAADADRTVLRSGVGPDITLSRAVSPLATYREHFADDEDDAELFRVEVAEGSPERVRIATLSHYDGEVFRVADPGGPVSEARFVRVPSPLEPGPGEQVRAHVSIAEMDGIWLPTIGATASVDFDGPRAVDLADGFYYSADLRAGVEVAGGGLEAGDAYTLSAVEPREPVLSEATAGGAPSAGTRVPDSLREWVDANIVGSGGEALQHLIVLLRERGYLSHAVSVDAQSPPEWMSDLEGYAFHPSAAGHSLARIDALFRSLLEREADDDPQGSLVAAVGDDEQFAVAAALIAEELGFPSRVVVGARLAATPDALPFCEEGVCRESDVAVWTEVSADGQWITLDVTPQSTLPPRADLTRQRDPENPTEVRPEGAREVVPPDPVQQDAPAPDDAEEGAAVDLTVLWRVLWFSAVVLAVLALFAGPLLVIVAAKWLRRRRRRRARDGASAIIGGWDEFVDAAVDRGRPRPDARTRSEIAALYGTPGAVVLAERADRAVFAADAGVSEADSAQFWRAVDDERRALAAGGGLWRALAAALSLRSFTRALSPRSPIARVGATPPHERRTRRPPGDTRSS